VTAPARATQGEAVEGRPAGERRLQDPEARLEHARALAWGALNRRERTEAELRAMLARKRVAPEDADVVVAELLASGYVDDARFAERFAEERRRLDGWGAERIEQRLRALGVDRETCAAAAGDRAREEELEAALALLRRRVPDVPETPRERDRALGILVRKGYALELARDALRRHAGVLPED
jgi:regulatory protein